MRTTLRWLHLSDLHMGLRDTGINRTEATALLIRDVKRILDDGDPLDLVLFTGDLVQSGQAQQFDELEKFVLEPLWRELGLPDDVPLLAVPGNHDLLRPDETTEPFAQSLVDEPAEIWKRGTKAYQFITERFAAYDNWWTNRWRGHARAHSLKLGMFPGDYLFTFEKNDVPFGFAGLNSAVTHLRNASAGELSISSAQLSELGDISSWLSNHAFNVLLTHHPSEWLTEGCRTSELANGICVPKFDLHLFGHMHEARILSSGDETRLQRTIQAASLFGRETWLRPTGKHREAVQRQFGYSLATLELRANRASFRICPRAAVKAHDHSYRFAPDPTYELKEFDPLFAEPFGPSFASAAAHRIKIETTVATLHSTPPAPPAWSSWIEGWQVWSRVEDPVERTKWRTFSQTVAEIWSRDWQTLCDAIPNDPWRDDTFAGRILDQLASLKPTKLSGKHAALLCLAPFLHEASWANALAQFSTACSDNLAPDPRGNLTRRALEQMHRAWPQVVRRATRVPPAAIVSIGLWFCYRAAERSPQRWNLATWLRNIIPPCPRTELDDFRDTLIGLARGVMADPEWLFGETTVLNRGERSGVHAGDLTAWIATASAAALDIRRFDETLVDHIGTDDETTISTVLLGIQYANWDRHRDVWTLQRICASPIEHFCLTQAVDRADELLDALRGVPDQDAAIQRLSRHHWPRRFSGTGLAPQMDSEGRARFSRRHVRFRLDHQRVRELLMGAQLYRDPALAIRELYQNALDACRYRRARQLHDGVPNYAPRIFLRQGRTADGRPFIECEDNGVGMTEQVLTHVFAVAGRRFHDTPQYHEERQRWEQRALAQAALALSGTGANGPAHSVAADPLRFQPNSQHGIGVLSYFMLADELEVHTRAYSRDDAPEQTGLRVRISSASGLFRIEDLPERALPESGTRVRLLLSSTGDSIAPGRRPPSLCSALEKLLWIAEFETVAYENCTTTAVDQVEVVEGPTTIQTTWEAGVPRTSIKLTPTIDPQIWWASGDCPLLVDGISTDETSPIGTLFNLVGERSPAMSADRRHTVGVTFDWSREILFQSIARLATSDWLELPWLLNFLGRAGGARNDAHVFARKIQPFFERLFEVGPLRLPKEWNTADPQAVLLALTQIDTQRPRIPRSPSPAWVERPLDSLWAFGAQLSRREGVASNPRNPSFRLVAAAVALQPTPDRSVPRALLNYCETDRLSDAIACLEDFGVAVAPALLMAKPNWAKGLTEEDLSLHALFFSWSASWEESERFASSESPRASTDPAIARPIALDGKALTRLANEARTLGLASDQIAKRLHSIANRFGCKLTVPAASLQQIIDGRLTAEDYLLLSRDLDDAPPWISQLTVGHVLRISKKLSVTPLEASRRLATLGLAVGIEGALERLQIGSVDIDALTSTDHEILENEHGYLWSLVTPHYQTLEEREACAARFSSAIERFHALGLSVPSTQDQRVLKNIARRTISLSDDDWTLLSKTLSRRGDLLQLASTAHVARAKSEITLPLPELAGRLYELAQMFEIAISPTLLDAAQDRFATLATVVAEDLSLFESDYDEVDPELLTIGDVFRAAGRLRRSIPDLLPPIERLTKALAMTPHIYGDLSSLVNALHNMTPAQPYRDYRSHVVLGQWLREYPYTEVSLLYAGRRWLWWLTDQQITDLSRIALALSGTPSSADPNLS